MKALQNIYTRVSLNVILIFIIMILFSFIPDLLRPFFGDWECTGSGEWILASDNSIGHWSGCRYCNEHVAGWHWGWRHWLWALMGWTLFFIQAARLAGMIDTFIDDGKKEKQ